MTMRHDVFLIPRLLIFSYKHTPAPSEAGNTSAEGRPQPSHSSLSLCPYGVRAARGGRARKPAVIAIIGAGRVSLQPISQDTYYEPLLHCSVTSHNCNREYPCHSAKFCWSSLTRLAESLLPPSRIYRSLFRGPGVRKLAACRF